MYAAIDGERSRILLLADRDVRNDQLQQRRIRCLLLQRVQRLLGDPFVASHQAVPGFRILGLNGRERAVIVHVLS